MRLSKKAEALRSQNAAIEKLERALGKITNGDFDIDVEIADSIPTEEREKFIKIKQHLLDMKDSFCRLGRDSEAMEEKKKSGNLDYTIDTEKYVGLYAKIGNDINKSARAASEPMQEVYARVAKLAANDFTESASHNYQGKLASLFDSIDNIQKHLLSAQNVVEKISRGDTGELDNFKKIGKRSENDHLVPAFIGMMEALRSMLDETARITAAAVDGELDVRGDASKFQGGYANLISSFNKSLDAMAAPLKAANDAIGRMRVNDFTEEMLKDFKGEYLALAT